MNNNHEKSLDTSRSFLLLSEIVGEEPLSQREISRRLGIAVGLVNSYLKNLVAKGYVRVKNFPRNRYAYLLTPQGFAEKGRLAYQHLTYFTGLYTVARQEYLGLFRNLAERGVTRVVFCGVDEVAEIAWLSLHESGLELAEVFDDECPGRDFMGRPVQMLVGTTNCPVVITSLKRMEKLHGRLLDLGMNEKNILTLDIS